MDRGMLIPLAACSTAQPSSNMSGEIGHAQQRTQRGGFSVLLKDAVQNRDHGQTPLLPDADDRIESPPSAAVDDPHEAASTAANKAESLPIANADASVNPNSTEPTLQSVDSTPLLLQGLTVVAPPDDGTLGHEPVATNPSQSKTTVSSSASLPQPALNPDSSSEVSAPPVDIPTTNQPVIRKGRGAPANLAPILLEHTSDVPALSGTRLPSSPMPDQGATPTMENQGNVNLLPAAQGQGNVLVLPLARPSTDIRPSALVQDQSDQKAALLSQSLSVRISETSGEGQGDAAQGEGEASFFQFNASGSPESVVRGNQSPLFSDQLMSARQAPPSTQGTGSPVGASTTDHMKLAQGLADGNHSGTTMSMSGMAQTVHLELPSHGAGPLNVRISMMDQTVHTQFTTDRSDLGALLLTRQDQLQQTLTKSGMELGQFQVHVNQEGRQDALPDRQSRRNDGPADQQPGSQNYNPQAHDRERPNHHPVHRLSLFA